MTRYPRLSSAWDRAVPVIDRVIAGAAGAAALALAVICALAPVRL